MKFPKITTLLFSFLLVAILAVSCQEGSIMDSHESSETNDPDVNAPTTLKVVLTDAPGDFEAVYIDIQEIRIRMAEEAKSDTAESDTAATDTTDHSDEYKDEWITISTDTQRVDLLTLRNGNTLTIGETEIEPGHYDQMRLVLGDNNEVVVDGESHYLKTPSAQQSGLKLKIVADIEAGTTYSLLVDFDAARSIVQAGNKRSPKGIKYLLKPVLRAVDLQASGSISGTVEPTDFSTKVYTIVDEDTISTVTASEGTFQILGLTPGFYDLTFEPDSSTFRDTTLTDVEVFSGEDTDVGTIVLEETGGNGGDGNGDGDGDDGGNGNG